jgi:GTP-binding protein
MGGEVPVIVTSAITGEGLRELRAELLRLVPAESGDHEVLRAAAPPSLPELAEHRVFRPAADRSWSVERVGDRSFRVSGRGIERLVARYDLDNEEALAHLERRLRGIGVIDALQGHGFEPGDDVEIAGVTFDLDPER